MPSNKQEMIKKLGSEEAYKQYMSQLAAKPHKRGGKTRIYVKYIGSEANIKVRSE